MFLKHMKTTHGEPHQTNLRMSILRWLKLSGGPFISRGHSINLRVGVQAMTKQKGKGRESSVSMSQEGLSSSIKELVPFIF